MWTSFMILAPNSVTSSKTQGRPRPAEIRATGSEIFREQQHFRYNKIAIFRSLHTHVKYIPSCTDQLV